MKLKRNIKIKKKNRKKDIKVSNESNHTNLLENEQADLFFNSTNLNEKINNVSNVYTAEDLNINKENTDLASSPNIFKYYYN